MNRKGRRFSKNTKKPEDLPLYRKTWQVWQYLGLWTQCKIYLKIAILIQTRNDLNINCLNKIKLETQTQPMSCKSKRRNKSQSLSEEWGGLECWVA